MRRGWLSAGITLAAAAALIVVVCAHGAASADDLVDWQTQAAEALQQATVTVRIWNVPKSSGNAAEALPAERPESVTVCSGVCVANGLIVTAALAGSDTPLRITMPGGKQADAKLRVIDEYSGLALLSSDVSMSPLELATSSPSVAAEVLTAAGWGVEKPLVSHGIIGGVDRTRAGTPYPPLLQCDLRSMQTSSGAGIVDRSRRLLGIVVAADSDDDRRGWVYAVPASHVQRILRADADRKADGVVVLKRRRPVVGMVLDQEDEAIVVARAVPGGPAEKAGIRVGDRVLAADGVAIRSVNQAVVPTIYKQPGDTTTFRVQRADGMHDCLVVLGGGVELPSAPLDVLAGLVQPKVELVRDDIGTIRRAPRGSVRPVSAPPLPDDDPPAAAEAPTPADRIAVLEKAIQRYLAVIELQQQQLADEAKQRKGQLEAIRKLQAELDELRQAAAPAEN